MLLSMFLRRISSFMSGSPWRNGSLTASKLSLAEFWHEPNLRFRNVGNVVEDCLERRAFLMAEGKNLFVAPNGSNLGLDLLHAFQENEPALRRQKAVHGADRSAKDAVHGNSHRRRFPVH